MTRPTEFRNEPLTDFTKPENRAAQQAAIDGVRAALGREYPILVGGEEIRTPEKLTSINPAATSEVIGVFQKGTVEIAEKALQTALRTFETWRHVPAAERAECCFRAAAIMRRRRFELNAWMIHEAGKSWIEADADTAEAIDFLDFYGLEALRYAGPQPITPVPGEKNELVYLPLGVGVAIPPWNFPLAILTGITTAPWVTGNTMILKPASTTPMMGWLYMEVIREAGVPPGVVSFLTGPGSIAGNYLVQHPKVRFINFTGSKEVGLEINQKAATPAAGQIWIKRVVAEMGGKDGIIVDRETDLDKAAQGVLASAFGYQGQKCSACSRAIVDAAVYDAFVAKLAEGVKKITLGDPRDPAVQMGPVIDKKAFDKILSYAQLGHEEGRILHGGRGDGSKGYFIEPTIVVDVDQKARLMQEEIFGPVLAVSKARDWKHALEIANDTEFGLTGAVYTDSPQKLAEATRDFFVGNLYLNRKCTGALVGGHPFGGFNMSGTDSKAGGRDYLLLFLQAKVVSAKIG